jgi:hypothetical protein
VRYYSGLHYQRDVLDWNDGKGYALALGPHSGKLAIARWSIWQDHPTAMAALARHDEIVRGSIERHGGYVFSTAGDAFAAAFSSATDALGAISVAQRLESRLETGDRRQPVDRK